MSGIRPARGQPRRRRRTCPNSCAIEAALGAENLKHEIGASYEALGTAQTHAVENAELSSSSEKYPVLLIFHGLRFNFLGYSMLAEDLASHGYIVVGIDFPAIAFAVNYPDGRMTRFSEATWSRPCSPDEAREFERSVVDQCARCRFRDRSTISARLRRIARPV